MLELLQLLLAIFLGHGILCLVNPVQTKPPHPPASAVADSGARPPNTPTPLNV